MSKITLLHYIKLAYRSVIFICAGVWYIRVKLGGHTVDINVFSGGAETVILIVVWVTLMTEMVFRLFPTKLKTAGCQKHFRKNYIPTGETEPKLTGNRSAAFFAFVWITGNALIGALYIFNIIDQGMLLMLTLAYSIGDIVSIVIFCPFQTWFIKNRCCSTCRIYNWDYAMMFTPFAFIPGLYTWSLLLMAILLLINWEIALRKYPERFSDNTNAYIKCINCNDKTCVLRKRTMSLFEK